jgi:hypothetical protein
MGIVRSMRAARGTLAILMLAPFLVGANHCLIGAVQGDTHMRCLQMAPAPSCCILVGPVPADAQVPAPVAADLFVAPAENAVQEATVTDTGWPVAWFESPPEAPPAASHSSRAPPLA